MEMVLITAVKKKALTLNLKSMLTAVEIFQKTGGMKEWIHNYTVEASMGRSDQPFLIIFAKRLRAHNADGIIALKK
jgi:hypothetical protein